MHLGYVPMLELFLHTAAWSASYWSIRAPQNAALYIFLFSTAVALLGVRGQRSQLWGQRRVAARGGWAEDLTEGCLLSAPPPISVGGTATPTLGCSRSIGRRSARESDDNKGAAVWTGGTRPSCFWLWRWSWRGGGSMGCRSDPSAGSQDAGKHCVTY